MRSGEPNKLWNSILNQSSVEDNIKKNRLKKKQSPNTWLESWDENNLIECKPKQITKPNYQPIQCWMIKLKKIN